MRSKAIRSCFYYRDFLVGFGGISDEFSQAMVCIFVIALGYQSTAFDGHKCKLIKYVSVWIRKNIAPEFDLSLTESWRNSVLELAFTRLIVLK